MTNTDYGTQNRRNLDEMTVEELRAEVRSCDERDAAYKARVRERALQARRDGMFSTDAQLNEALAHLGLDPVDTSDDYAYYLPVTVQFNLVTAADTASEATLRETQDLINSQNRVVNDVFRAGLEHLISERLPESASALSVARVRTSTGYTERIRRTEVA